MKTVVTDSIEVAAGFLKTGGIAAFPTETVYGLGASLFDAAAVSKIFAAKGRPADNPLIAHVSNMEQIKRVSRDVPPYAFELINAFFPGPLTIVVSKSESIPDIVTAGLNTVGIRMPDHKAAAALIGASGTPLAAPSANLSGKPSPTTWQAVLEDLDGRIDCILKGETSAHGIESTVVDCSGPVPQILRTGAITIEKLRTVVPSIEAFQLTDSGSPRSPGLKHKHYSPEALVRIYRPEIAIEPNSAYIGIARHKGEFTRSLICEDVAEYARNLYEYFRSCDRDNISNIYCEAVPETGLGTALMDRIRRATEK